MDKYVIGNGYITDGIEFFIENGAILVENGKIAKIGKTADLKNLADEFIDIDGRILMPGFVNPHHHLYSALAAGLGPIKIPNDFREILDYLWWQLDKALDEESTYYSAMSGIIGSIKCGVTTIVDHHASMNYVSGSLNTIKNAFDKAGIRGCLCFETSDRMGDAAVQEHIKENIDFFESNRDNDFIAGAFGMHANFTLSEKSMQSIAISKPDDMPIHVHVAEDLYDAEFCRELGYKGAFDRLMHYKMVNENSLIGHAIHLSDAEYASLNEINPFTIENAESNANNGVGFMDNSKVNNFVIGTDGMTGDIVGSWRSHYLLKGGGDMSYFTNIMRQTEALKAKLFPGSEKLQEGFNADLAILDYRPQTPISIDNLMGHLVFGAKTGNAYMTVCNGEIIYQNGIFNTIDIADFQKNVVNVSKTLWDRFYK